MAATLRGLDHAAPADQLPHDPMPRSGNVLPAGPYLLLVNGKGNGGKVPSVAQQVFIRGG